MEKLNHTMKKRLNDTKFIEDTASTTEITNIYDSIESIDYQNSSIKRIWNAVFDIIEQKCISRNYFTPSSSIYI